jgi:hypothetical protein
MAQVALADSLQLPPDSTGKRTGMAKVNIGGTDVYLPASVLTDAGGNIIDSATAAPAGTERGLITRNVPSGTQPVSLAAIPTVTEKQDQPTATAVTWTSATALNTASAVTTTGYGTANVFVVVPTTVTAGVISIEVSNDGGTTYVPGGAVRVDNGYQENVVALAFAPGINGSRMYSVSVDAMTHVRARLSTVITGTGNVVVTISTVAGGIEPFVAHRSRKVSTYRAQFRKATRAYALSNVFAAAGRKQYATIHHAATATKTVRLRRVRVLLESTTAAGNFWVFELVRITTAPATGNPAITAPRLDSSSAAPEATLLALPTTAATEEAQPIAHVTYSVGTTGAAPTSQPHMSEAWVDLWVGSTGDDEAQIPTIRAGVLEGWAVTVDAAGATTLNGYVDIEFTEEAP